MYLAVSKNDNPHTRKGYLNTIIFWCVTVESCWFQDVIYCSNLVYYITTNCSCCRRNDEPAVVRIIKEATPLFPFNLIFRRTLVVHLLYFPEHEDALQMPGTAMSVEDNHLVLQYSGRLGGRPSTGATNHLRRNLDCVVIAHKPSGGKGFTCNPRVTVADVYGQHNDGGSAAPVLPLMSQIPFPGADMDLPDRALQFLINRWLVLVAHRSICYNFQKSRKECRKGFRSRALQECCGNRIKLSTTYCCELGRVEAFVSAHSAYTRFKQMIYSTINTYIHMAH